MTASISTTLAPPKDRRDRLSSVDVLRGAAIVVMALDHVRDFLTNARFEPEDLAHTNPALFFTRWITHFCAPIFCFLAGSGASFLLAGTRSTAGVATFLWTRGLWLILLEFTIIDFAWTFVPWAMAGVVFMLGASMIALAAFVRLPRWLIATGSLLVIFAHDALDGIPPARFGTLGFVWQFLHVQGYTALPPFISAFFVLYPLVPWFAVMAAGFAFGSIMEQKAAQRRQSATLLIGVAATLLFVILRAGKAYGNAPASLGGPADGTWHVQSNLAMTVVAFLNVEKYPPSLQYLLMTLGPALVLLSILDRCSSSPRFESFVQPLRTFGRVPLFFYIGHLFVIHIVAIGLGSVTHMPIAWLVHGGFFLNDVPSGFGFELPVIYVAWLLIVALMYVPCTWYASFKSRSRSRLLSYL